MISVVPLFHNVVSIRHLIISQKRPYFLIGKSKIFIILHIRDRHHFHIIQPGKNTFLRYAQTSRKHGEIQIVVCFQGIAEHLTQQGHHLLVIAFLICLRQGHIILVDQDDDPAVIVLMQEHGQCFQTGCQHRF